MSSPTLPNNYLQLLPSFRALHVPCSHQEVTSLQPPIEEQLAAERCFPVLLFVRLGQPHSPGLSLEPMCHWEPPHPQISTFLLSVPALAEGSNISPQPALSQVPAVSNCAGFLSAALCALGRALQPNSSASPVKAAVFICN